MLISRRADRTTWALWIGLLVAAQAADLGTTAASLRLGGLETNPLVLGIISRGGIDDYVLVKLASMIVVVSLFSIASWLGRWLPSHTSDKVFRTLIRGLQVAVGVQILAALANLVVVGGQLRA